MRSIHTQPLARARGKKLATTATTTATSVCIVLIVLICIVFSTVLYVFISTTITTTAL